MKMFNIDMGDQLYTTILSSMCLHKNKGNYTICMQMDITSSENTTIYMLYLTNGFCHSKDVSHTFSICTIIQKKIEKLYIPLHIYLHIHLHTHKLNWKLNTEKKNLMLKIEY